MLNRAELEIKHIDSEMKTLVYENYNKLIDATDTIGHVFSFMIYYTEVIIDASIV